jgi:AraC-like DNA-binding protein
MTHSQPIRVKSISAFHTLRGLPKPLHPLISVVRFEDMQNRPAKGDESLLFDFYTISVKRGMNHLYKYGQQHYDFEEGLLFFMAPNQVLKIEVGDEPRQPTGWMLLIHPDFLWNKPLAASIRKYEFFHYSLHEALFLSAAEEQTIEQIIRHIREECERNIDTFSQDIIISQLETLLHYSDRFYQRQFITRDKANHQMLDRLEQLLDTRLNVETLTTQGQPTVQWVAEQLNISSGYLRSLLKMLTGLNTQQYINQKLTEIAKEKLGTTQLGIGEIAFELGFEHSQSFNKFFKKQTSLTPVAFRQQFPD